MYKTELLENTNSHGLWKHFDPEALDDLFKVFPNYSSYTRDIEKLMCLAGGFHSMSIVRCYELTQYNHVVCEGIIPKGSKYYRDPSKTLLVSNQIIITNVIKNG